MIGSRENIGNYQTGRGLGGDAKGVDEYRRRARRLRGAYGGRPGVLYRRLSELSQSQPKRPKNARKTSENPFNLPTKPSLLGGSSVAWEFAGRVEEGMKYGVLRYSERTRLIKEAEGMGIGRFEANLIIAVVEHRGRGKVVREAKRRRGWAGVIGVAVGVQAVIMGVVWWVVWG